MAIRMGPVSRAKSLQNFRNKPTFPLFPERFADHAFVRVKAEELRFRQAFEDRFSRFPV